MVVYRVTMKKSSVCRQSAGGKNNMVTFICITDNFCYFIAHLITIENARFRIELNTKPLYRICDTVSGSLTD